jgi:hypothetical protein
MEASAAAKLSQEICAKIAPLLANNAPEVQSAALADLTAMWLAGHFVNNNIAETRKLRQLLLHEHIKLIQQLIPLNEKKLLQGLIKH